MEFGACCVAVAGSDAGMPLDPASAGGTSSARAAGVSFRDGECDGFVVEEDGGPGTEATTGAVVGWRVART